MNSEVKTANCKHQSIPAIIKRRVRRMPALWMLAMRRPRNLSKNKNIHHTDPMSNNFKYRTWCSALITIRLLRMRPPSQKHWLTDRKLNHHPVKESGCSMSHRKKPSNTFHHFYPKNMYYNCQMKQTKTWPGRYSSMHPGQYSKLY